VSAFLCTSRARPRLSVAAVVASSLVAMWTLGGCASQGAATAVDAASSAARITPGQGAASPLGSLSPVPAASPSRGPAAPPAPSPTASPTASPNGTLDNSLTISDGSPDVLMNGGTADFGIPVSGLAWSPDGTRAAFVDGNGDLIVAGPDGGARVEVAANPGGQTWSHPTWLTSTDVSREGAGVFLMFVSTSHGVSVLKEVPVGSGPAVATLAGLDHGDGDPAVPQTGDLWPSAAQSVAHGTLSVFEHDAGSVSEVYIRDDYLREQCYELFDGAEPAISPDGTDVVFTRSVEGHQHLFLADLNDGDYNNVAVTELTPGVTQSETAPAWSPDGKTIAYSTPGGVWKVAADGGTPMLVSPQPGVPSYR
jgi:dipeptidyl aminopeptidase/acylaminoacyl peptidase